MTGRYSVDPYKDYLHTDYTFTSYPFIKELYEGYLCKTCLYKDYPL